MLVAQTKVEEYRVGSGLVGGTDLTGQQTSLTGQKIFQINGQLVEARVERDALHARLGAIASRFDNRSSAENAVDVLESEHIQELKVQEAVLHRRKAELATIYGNRHPRMIEIQANALDLQRRIELEVARIVLGMQMEVNIAGVRVDSLEKSLKQLTGKFALENKTQIRLAELERRAEADREIYQVFLTRFKETSEQIDFQQPDARVVSAAVVPRSPSAPGRLQMIGFALFVSILTGLFLALVREKMQRGIHTVDELERNWGARVIGIVPDFQEAGFARIRGARRSRDRVSENPVSGYNEAIQKLRTYLRLSDAVETSKVVLFTSSVDNEGKTTVSETFAKIAAARGQKTIHVNCDCARHDRSQGYPRNSFGRFWDAPLAVIARGTAKAST